MSCLMTLFKNETILFNLQIPTVTTANKHLATVVRNNFLLTGRNLKKRLGENVGGHVPQERERERISQQQ